jgi:hypothetical protein
MGRSLTGFYYAPNAWIPVLFVSLFVILCYGLARLLKTVHLWHLYTYNFISHLGTTWVVHYFFLWWIGFCFWYTTFQLLY